MDTEFSSLCRQYEILVLACCGHSFLAVLHFHFSYILGGWIDLSIPWFLFFISRSAHLCLHLCFQALVEKLNLGQENLLNFALFEIMEDGFGE